MKSCPFNIRNTLRIVFLLFSLVFIQFGFSQRLNIDSLQTALKNTTNEIEELELSFELAKQYVKSNSDSAKIYFQNAIKLVDAYLVEDQASYYSSYINFLYNRGQFHLADSLAAKAILKESKQNSISENLGMLHELRGAIAIQRGNVESTIEHYQKGEEVFSKLSPTTKSKGDFFSNYAGTLVQIGDSEQAIEKYLLAIKYYKEGNAFESLSLLYLNMGIFHLNQKQFEKAKEYGELAIDNLQLYPNEFFLGHANDLMTAISSELKQPQKAEQYSMESLRIWNKLGIKQGEAQARRGLAILLREKNDFSEALNQINISIELLETVDDEESMMNSLAEKAMILAHLGNKNLSQKTLEITKKIHEKIPANATINMKFFEAMEKIHALNKDFDKAYESRLKYAVLQDSMTNSKHLAKISELETQYFTKEKDAALQLQESQLSKQKYLLWFIGIVAGLLMLLAFIFWQNAQKNKMVNQKLQQLDKAKSRFFANISHELRTPLTLILAPLENALLKVKSKTAKDDLQLAHSNSKKLLTLVNEILDLSKLESGKMEMKEKPVALEPLLRRIFFSFHSVAQLRGLILSLSYHLPKNLGIHLDVEKFEKVLNNLLSNAFKYSQKGGTITLRAFEENGQLQLEVQDTGKGIAPEQLEKIFDRFYQIESESEPLQGGTGIGLAYAKEIARLFGGDLKVKSELGNGSTFIFSLPMKKAKLNVSINEEEQEVESIMDEKTSPVFSLQKGKPNILIVEDNPEMSGFLVDTLSQQYNCRTALDGEEAMKMVEAEHFDLITSDVMMPNMDGFTLLEKIRDVENFKNTSFVLLTARAMEEDKLKGFRLGVDDYLTKPFSTKELMARIENLLQNKANREAYQDEESSEIIENQEVSFEGQLLKKAEKLVLENINNSDFKVTDLAEALNYSRRQLIRILKKNTGLTPVEFIREIRLQKAYRLLESRQFATIAEVRYEVGMEDASHFSKKFQERFGKMPSEITETY